MADGTFAEGGRFEHSRRFEATAIQTVWVSRPSSLDLRACAVCGPGFHRRFEIVWAKDGRLRRGTQFVMDEKRTDAVKAGVALAERADAEDFFWEDLGHAAPRPSQDAAAIDFEGSFLHAVAAAGRTASTDTPLRHVGLSREYRSTALVLEWVVGARLQRLALGVPLGPVFDEAAQGLVAEMLFELDEGIWSAIDVGPA